MKWTATFLVYWQKTYNKRGGWCCGLPRLVSTFLANNKACLCLDEPLWALSFHNPRPLSLCFADPMCQWIKIWAKGMDWAIQHCFIKRRQTCQGLVRKLKSPTQDSFSSLIHYKCFKNNPSEERQYEKIYLFTCWSVKLSYGAFPSTRHRKITALGQSWMNISSSLECKAEDKHKTFIQMKSDT